MTVESLLIVLGMNTLEMTEIYDGEKLISDWSTVINRTVSLVAWTHAGIEVYLF